MWLGMLAAAAIAQDPGDRWFAFRTEHYRVFAPESARDWAVHMGERLESMRARVVHEVGYDPPGRITLIVRDPYSESNGMAFPYLRDPRIEVWTTPPGPGSGLEAYRSWDEILLEHETAHILHLNRPSRNPWVAAGDLVIGIGPMTRKTPRWVAEGYATVVEGRLSGSGRPNSDGRATWIRHLAAEGRMPTYGELDGNARWGGGSDAYLVGSAFLEWLEARRGPGSLRDLWAAMTARKNRNFDAAFARVFDEYPAVLYGRFVAETTGAAMVLEAERGPPTGALFADLGGWAGSPAVSPDGTRVAVPSVSTDGRHRAVNVWAVAEDAEARQEWSEAVEKQLARDPEDVRPVHPEPFLKSEGRRVRFARPTTTVRWLRDGSALLLVAWMQDADGRFRPDLFRWDPETGRERRVTRRADVKDADPAPDGTWAVAVRARFGSTQLVRVDLATGEVSELTVEDPVRVVAQPRVSPDGSRILWVENGRGPWRIVLRDVAGGEPRDLVLPDGASAADVAWMPDGEGVLASVGSGGFVEVWKIGLDGTTEVLTRSRGGAYAPEPTPDGLSLFWLAEDADGHDVFRGPLAAVATPGVDGPAPVVRSADPPVVTAPDAQPLDIRHYGLGRLDPRLLWGASGSPASGETALGLRLGDPAGRWQVLGQAVSGTLSGGQGSLVLDVLPVTVVGTGWWAWEFAEPAHIGASLGLERRIDWTSGALELGVAGWTDRVGPRGMLAGGGTVGVTQIEPRTGWLTVDAEGSLETGVVASGEWTRLVVGGELAIGPYERLVLGYSRGEIAGLGPQFVLGGTWSSLHPDGMNRGILTGPWHGDGVRGPAFDRMLVAVDVPWRVEVERVRVFDETGEAWASTQVGARLDYELERTPFQKLPGGVITSGLACRVEVDDAIDAAPCAELSDWALWGSVRWVP